MEVFNKPLDMPRLKAAIATELLRRATHRIHHRRTQRLRRLARRYNLQRKDARRQLDTTCADLTMGYRKLSRQLSLQKLAMEFQQGLLLADNDDDVFRALFGMYVSHSGPVFGAAMVCDAEAQLQLVGRFGVPNPDPAPFCLTLSKPLIDMVLTDPHATLLDAGERADLFGPSIRKFLVGLSVLAVPLVPVAGQMIGMVMLYRKGEQPFMDSDVALAEMISLPAALAIQRND